MWHSLAVYFGYLASLFLILAIIINNDLKFRWFSALGNVFFITYAFILDAIPVMITNGILLGINIFYLFRIYRRTENFDLLEFSGTESLAQKFLLFYKADIAGYFPDFHPKNLTRNLNFVVTRDLVIANMFSANLTPGGDAEVQLNYTLKKFRDYKVGSYIFDKEKNFLIAKGIKRIVYLSVSNKSHLKFLKRSGFKKEMLQGQPGYIKVLIKIV